MFELTIIATAYSWKIMQRILNRAEKHLDKAEKLPAHWRKKKGELQNKQSIQVVQRQLNGKKAGRA